MSINYKKCFYCGSLHVAKVIYGYPSVEIMEKGRIKLGGCAISEDSPQYHCNKCEAEWTKQEAIKAAYDQIIGIHASVGGFSQGYYAVTVNFQTKNLTWTHCLSNQFIEKTISQSTIEHFRNELQKIELLNWKRNYNDPSILDGTQWEIVIIREKRNLKRSGSNQFPPEWEEFCETIITISGEEFR